MNYMEQLALRLAQARKERGISQAELARRTGGAVHPSTVTKIESGERGISINVANQLCQSLNLRLSDLIAVLDDGKPLVTVPKTVEVGGHTYVLQEDAS